MLVWWCASCVPCLFALEVVYWHTVFSGGPSDTVDGFLAKVPNRKVASAVEVKHSNSSSEQIYQPFVM